MFVLSAALSLHDACGATLHRQLRPQSLAARPIMASDPAPMPTPPEGFVWALEDEEEDANIGAGDDDAQTKEAAVDGVVEPTMADSGWSAGSNPNLCAPGEEYKEAVYTKGDYHGTASIYGDDDDGGEPFVPADPEVGWVPLDGGEKLKHAPAPPQPLGPLLEELVAAAEACVLDPDPDAQEAYGDWCRDGARERLVEALRGLRGKKLAWWLDAPRPLRAVIARGSKYEISVVCLPNGQTLPPAAWPRGSVSFCQPLLGRFSVRRLRFDITGKVETPIELMKRQLTFGDKPLMLSGGSCLEFTGVPGAAAAFLQVAMLPPTSNLPRQGSAADGSIGWRRPPGESCESNLDVVAGVTLGVDACRDLVVLDKPTAETLAAERAIDRAAGPADKQGLVDVIGERVGGLDRVVNSIVRRALAARLYPPELTRPLGVRPVRGVLLYGPPGCGKTLLAREIASAMGAREPKVVNGPEMMSKFVGDSEEYIRSLFADAEIEQAEKGADSALHVIVFDEMDAFTRERGTLSGDTSGIRDSVVNQLLAKMDGVDALDNVLVIGMTNRPELMDPALLRPGRLEVHAEVARPDRDGRQRIAAIHSRRLRERGTLDATAVACLSSGALADATEGFSGADIAGMFRSAISFALERHVDETLLREARGPGGGGDDAGGSRGVLEVRFEDLARALGEVRPAGDAATRADLASSARGLASRAVTGYRGWRRRARLARATKKALAAMQTTSAAS